MLYAISVYLLNGVKGVLLGSLGGLIVLFVAQSALALLPGRNRLGDTAHGATNLLLLSAALGAVLGIAFSVLRSRRILRDAARPPSAPPPADTSVWPPPPSV